MARRPPLDQPHVLTANRLHDGAVLYRTQDGQWSRSLEDARIESPLAAREALLAEADADVAAARVVAPTLIPVAEDQGRPRPLSLRERLRAEGPSLALPHDTPLPRPGELRDVSV
ncbi:DUF2849 domain-containing protein [Pararhodospirillum photometricum]|nr:DUF2849 domain-containing protein [Pararhodospirillum photometricum]